MSRPVLLLTLVSAAGLAAAPASGAPAPSKAEMIAMAISAAPPAIGAHAGVMALDGKGGMVTLRQGTNGFTCVPDDPATPGPDPMCVDANGMDWMMAYLAHKPPAKGKVGFAYMLRGGTDASNLDPFATKPANGKWVTTGPHVMVLSAEVAAASGYPTRQAEPDTSRPYVMFGGTPYAHVMAPVR